MEDEPDGTSGSKVKTPKDEKRREQVLVASAIAGLVLTVLILRRSGSSSQAAALPVAATPVGNTGGGTPSGGDFTSLANQIYGLQGGINTLLGSMQGSSSSPTAISHTTYNAQDVRDIFARYGDSNDALIGTDTYRATGETGGQRVDRIVRDLNSGARTIDQVNTSISQLPHSPSRNVSGAMPTVGANGGSSR